MEKKSEFKELHFEESLFLTDSMCTENHNVRLMDKDPISNIDEKDICRRIRETTTKFIEIN